ncbi:response regulator transcription factor [Bifidobacterium callitrichos]|nr:response regulator transcription factor [Bifidobacterium callitrichos]
MKPTMLIMDNDRMALLAMRTILAGILTDIAILPPVTEGAQAIRQCTDAVDPPSILLADVAMNDINGPAVVRTIRRENATTAVLAITASVVERHAGEMADAGAQGIISKNDDARLQALAIRQVLAGHTWQPENGDVRFQTVADAHRRILAQGDTSLTAREMEITDLWSRGRTVPEIAQELNIGATTVRTHLNRAAGKLGAGNLKELIGAWIRMTMH